MGVYIIGEIGINHNGSLATAIQMIDMAKSAGCDAVKFQKRTVDAVVPKDKWDAPKDTPWGTMPYIEYKRRLELPLDDFNVIDEHCKEIGIEWFTSAWDVEALAMMDEYNPRYHKVASALVTNIPFLNAVRETGRDVIMSTGMSTFDEVRRAVSVFTASPPRSVSLLHCVSCYPCENKDVHLRTMETLRDMFMCAVGYSGHERGNQVTLAAVALGAPIVERHITLDRTMFGSDQAASLEPPRLRKLCEDIRAIEVAMGAPEFKVHDCELASRKALRGT